MGNIYCDRILKKGRRDEVVFWFFEPREAACDMYVLKSCREMKKGREKKRGDLREGLSRRGTRE